ncbi:hypothetical protein PSACC_02685 [Paramicrosporidium saccamoebae]|uniref:Uncharacterized protein n=1 Tax=Paramicrosporidium saccamoebae TaxID=1246581 RepID=A0A2H9TIQ6_9FUNG|nr:hypothetical protein PSACC_02685 [Paramicrosporidium saccamoebae]
MYLPALLSFAILAYASRFTPHASIVHPQTFAEATEYGYCTVVAAITIDITLSVPDSEDVRVESLVLGESLTVKEIVTSILGTFPEELVQEIGPISLVITRPVGKALKVEKDKINHYNYLSVFLKQKDMLDQPYNGEIFRGVGLPEYFSSTFTAKSEGLVWASRTATPSMMRADAATYAPGGSMDPLVIEQKLPLLKVVDSVLQCLPEKVQAAVFPLIVSIRDPAGEPLVTGKIDLGRFREVQTDQCMALSEGLGGSGTSYYASTFISKGGKAESHLIVTRQSATGIILSLIDIFGN